LGLAEDRNGLEIFQGGKDIYLEFAKIITEKSDDAVGEYRKVAKVIVLARIIRQNTKNLVTQAFQPVQKTLCFFELFITILYFNGLSYISKTSCIRWVRAFKWGNRISHSTETHGCRNQFVIGAGR
jgi:hypothetical protein